MFPVCWADWFSARQSGGCLMRLPLTAGQALCFLEQVWKLAASFSFFGFRRRSGQKNWIRGRLRRGYAQLLYHVFNWKDIAYIAAGVPVTSSEAKRPPLPFIVLRFVFEADGRSNQLPFIPPRCWRMKTWLWCCNFTAINVREPWSNPRNVKAEKCIKNTLRLGLEWGGVEIQSAGCADANK